jgi:glucosamine--fructose-6-phosphate aminotransferase (isomerizing)
MCGIVAVLAKPSDRDVPDLEAAAGRLRPVLERATDSLAQVDSRPGSLDGRGIIASVEAVVGELVALDATLRGPVGLRALLGDPKGAQAIGALVAGFELSLESFVAHLEQAALVGYDSDLAALEELLGKAKDATWSVSKDRLGMAARVEALLRRRGTPPAGSLDGWWAIGVALAALDRLEVRGRDSAGLHVMVAGASAQDGKSVAGRAGDMSFPSGSARLVDEGGGVACFVYKAAAEIGELGDNVRHLAEAIADDGALAEALAGEGSRVTIVAHTRWASVGIISEPNAHPVNSDELGRPSAPYVAAALNGDVDNHLELSRVESLAPPPEVTTDAKVIPMLMARRLSEGLSPPEAFAATVARLEGSLAIAASSARSPDDLYLALTGSGQSLYVGLADNAFVVASEPYGLVEETDSFLRMDGDSTGGEIVTLARSCAGTLDGISRRRYNGATAIVRPDEVRRAGITTRDVDRRGYEHFLLKEITESPDSFRKTMRGRLLMGSDGRASVVLDAQTLPDSIRHAWREGAIKEILVVGQGTAAVAGQAVASALRYCVAGTVVEALPATELSGFMLRDDMSDTLVIAISQSGTTTDTNRTVDLVRHRGARVLAVVNRRNSDLATKAHGVFYTSDGRDVEMSVASTKAFYSQVAAGWLIAAGLAATYPARAALGEADLASVLAALLKLPSQMEAVLAKRGTIAAIATEVAPPRKFWAVVGNGPDRVAAAEVRIKLSELCYRSISADYTEDKKHIDLSCEPLVIVCASGLAGANADDVAKEVAIYNAHKALPVVIASEGEQFRFEALGARVVTVPSAHRAVGFVLSAMVGHLFGYEAALAIDAQARVLRVVREAAEAGLTRQSGFSKADQESVAQTAEPFVVALREGRYDGNLSASTAVRLTGLLRYATGQAPLEGFEAETGKIGTPQAIHADLVDALNGAIDELTRPVDAIKHQAKTVTVGISRSESALLGVPLVAAVLAAGPSADSLGYRALRTLASLDAAVDEVLGYTRYRVDWGADGSNATASVVDMSGVAARIAPSRTARDPRLLGSKHRAAEEREVTVVRGARDGRTVVLVPEAKDGEVCGMTLLHVRIAERLPSEAAAEVLAGYRTRLDALRDAVTETEEHFELSRLGLEPLVDLLTEPVYQLAQRWRSKQT